MDMIISHCQKLRRRRIACADDYSVFSREGWKQQSVVLEARGFVPLQAEAHGGGYASSMESSYTGSSGSDASTVLGAWPSQGSDASSLRNRSLTVMEGLEVGANPSR